MKRRKAKLSIFDIGRLPLSQPVIKEPLFRSWKQLEQEERLEQTRIKAEQVAAEARAKAEAERPIKALESEFNKSLRELRAIQRETLFTRPSDELSSRCAKRPAQTEGTADEIAQRVLAAARGGIKVNLTESGREKVLTVIRANPELDTTDALTWAEVYSHITECGAWSPEDGVPAEQPHPQPQTPQPVAPEESFDALLERTSTESRAARPLLLAALEKEHNREAIPLFHEWVRHLSSDYGFTLSQEDAKYILEVMFPQNNWSFLRADNFNLARRAMVAQYRWPSSMLTEVERLTKELEDIPSTDYFRYREAKQRLFNAEAAERGQSQ